MKKLILLSIGLVLLPLIAIAQSVPGFSYQAIARDANGDVISEQQVGIQISILENSVDGPLAYMEEFYPTTNEFGIINLTIGTGSATYGNFESIDWSVGQYFVGVAMDTEGGQEFVDMSTSQLLSVPYAMYAKSAESAKSVDNIDAKTISDLKQSLSDVQTQLKSINYELMGSGTFVDARDNEIYTWVETDDNKIWMADNLRAEIYTDSTVISGAMDYDGDPAISQEYGKLYTYEAIVESGKNICPEGYRMPTDAEWSALLAKYGGPVFAGAKMKEAGVFHWNSEAAGVTNDAQTSIIPAGMVASDGSSAGLGTRAYIWTASESTESSDYAVAYQYCAEHNIVVKLNLKKNAGISIRCIKE